MTYFKCSKCKRLLETSSSAIGQIEACPACGHSQTVPERTVTRLFRLLLGQLRRFYRMGAACIKHLGVGVSGEQVLAPTEQKPVPTEQEPTPGNTGMRARLFVLAGVGLFILLILLLCMSGRESPNPIPDAPPTAAEIEDQKRQAEWDAEEWRIRLRKQKEEEDAWIRKKVFEHAEERGRNRRGD